MEIVIVWVILCFAVGSYAKNRGLNYGTYFLGSLLLSPLIGFVLAAVSKPNVAAVEAAAVQSGQGRKCPFCAEIIKPEALVCRFCGKDLPAYTPPVQVQRPQGLSKEEVDRILEERKAKGMKTWKMALILLAVFAAIMAFGYFINNGGRF